MAISSPWGHEGLGRHPGMSCSRGVSQPCQMLEYPPAAPCCPSMDFTWDLPVQRCLDLGVKCVRAECVHTAHPPGGEIGWNWKFSTSQSHPGAPLLHNEAETGRLRDLGSPHQHRSHRTQLPTWERWNCPSAGLGGDEHTGCPSSPPGGTGPPSCRVPGRFPECASLFDLQVEIPCAGRELNGVPLDKGSQAAFQAPGASRDLPFFV